MERHVLVQRTTRATLALALVSLGGCATFEFSRDDDERLVRATAPDFVSGEAYVLQSGQQGVVGDLRVIEARDSDTLPRLARQFDLGHDEMLRANPGVDTWLPGEGTQIVLPTAFVLPDAPREGVVINVAARRLFYYPPAADGEPQTVITHPIGIGRDEWPTPTGVTEITEKVAGPAWYVPQSIRKEHAAAGDPLPAVVPPGPDNPLGTHALLLGMPGYLIHGTNKPYGVGMRVSHGCIRLYPEDIEPFFERVPVGTPVRIVDQPTVAGWRNGGLYVQAYTPLTEDAFTEEQLRDLLDEAMARVENAPPLDWERSRATAQSPRAIPVPVLEGSHALDSVIAQAALVQRPPEADAEVETETASLLSPVPDTATSSH